MSFPTGEPSWQVNDLEASAAGQLSGINPLVLSGIAQNESGWEVKGPGINPEGFGGFYGLGENSSYPAGASSATLLMDPSDQSFQEQSVLAASALASYLGETGGNLEEAVATYVSGKPGGSGGADWTDVESALGGAPATSGSSSGAANATLDKLDLNPLNLFGIPQTVAGSVWS